MLWNAKPVESLSYKEPNMRIIPYVVISGVIWGSLF